MDFYVDESGAFSIPPGFMQHNACVVVCVVISDLKKEHLKNEFESFSSNLPADLLVNGEPKGSKFDNHKKFEFCEMLSRFKDNLLIIPITLDMTLISMLSDQNNLKQKLHDACIEYCDYMQQESLKNELRLLARQWMNISYQETLKIACYAYVLFISMRHSILALSTGGNEVSWNKVNIEIDRSNKKLNSREKIIFSKMLGMWFESWSRKEPFAFIRQIHDQHFLVKNCNSQDGLNHEELNHGEIIKDINWGDSKDSWGLQVADIACSIVYSAANDLENQKGSFAPFCN
jgi:hypothetical protein